MLGGETLVQKFNSDMLKTKSALVQTNSQRIWTKSDLIISKTVWGEAGW